MSRNTNLKRQMVSLGVVNTAVLQGTEDLSNWDEEELRRGQKRNRHGRWPSRPPKVVPKAIHDELVRRTLSEAHRILVESVVDAVSLWATVLNDSDADMKYRMEAAKEIKEAVMGKAPINVHVEAALTEESSVWDRIGHTVVIREKQEAIEVNSHGD